MSPFSPFIRATTPPPVMEARRWIQGKTFPADRPLINLSQAAPIDPPPEALRAQMARMVVNEPDTHLYGPVLGLPALRAEIAGRWSAAYGGEIEPADVAITGGCNMAFCAALATLAIPGDAILLPVPWYFNHKMWCDTVGIDAIPLPCDARMNPDIEAARPLMSGHVKAIVLITPNNPTGAEYPAGLVAAFAALARAHGAALILDETYRDFDSRETRPHNLFADPGWRDVLIHLYSFSKAFRLTGHRTGAIITSPERLAEVEKFMDSVAICAPTLGQKAALWGLRHLGDWVAGERAEILRRREAITRGLARLPGWKLLGAGAYFAYVEHPFAMRSDELCRFLVDEQSILTLPGTMFSPDPEGARQIRIAFANADPDGLGRALDRLAELTHRLPRRDAPPLATPLASPEASA
ncbi:aminotransferase [Amaricoccus solimangrovi]|uniref:aspartate transaminase n=1 Tax=Amaricoccus solimangrovi TaxID=2589815 RepID=A0A501WJZ8_9RHOB|nr:aminotransferase [Amaricoccus solimangrovi]TPE47361.1 aminotransferase [Amaricoccus solimangrovi]